MQPVQTFQVLAITLPEVGGLIAAFIVSSGALMAIVFLLLRGAWAKYGEPLVKHTLAQVIAEPAQKSVRDLEMDKAIKEHLQEKDHKRVVDIVEGWHKSDDQRESRTKFVNDVIGNSVNRVDGEIYQAISKEVGVVKETTKATTDQLIGSINASLHEMKQIKDRQAQLETMINERLGRLEGGVEALLSMAKSNPRSRKMP